ncbi:hypothetical protein R70723_28935 [Paenibacillus sp. FSL R7-0273]|nr:hypothetical protein R70723_28935 [Paenibacillus sp. FSL R7-0273]OMF89728.1 hypothetical protein BK144_19055 [Paenibacillus sp. FSL R7-0273]
MRKIGFTLLAVSLLAIHAATGQIAEAAAPIVGSIKVSGTPLDFETVKPDNDAAFHEGLLFGLQADGTEVYYNTSGQPAFTLPEHIVPEAEFAEQRAVVQDTATGLFGFINTKGDIAVPCVYASAGNFSGGVAHVALPGGSEEALIDRHGRTVAALTEKFSSDFIFTEGLSTAYAPGGSGLIGYINTAGRLAIPYQYHSGSRGFTEGLAVVQNKAGLYGYIGTSGQTVIPFQYKSAGMFSEGLAAVQNAKGKWGFINKQGKLVIDYKYANTGSFSEGLVNVYNSAGKAGFINKAGKLVIGYQIYNHAFSFREGAALVGISDSTGKKADQYGYINTSGKLLTKLIYTRESSPFSGCYAVGVTEIGTGYILNKQGAGKR